MKYLDNVPVKYTEQDIASFILSQDIDFKSKKIDKSLYNKWYYEAYKNKISVTKRIIYLNKKNNSNNVDKIK